eukprot:2750746-Pyramimonas_sp.AAC.1
MSCRKYSAPVVLENPLASPMWKEPVQESLVEHRRYVAAVGTFWALLRFLGRDALGETEFVR